MARWVRHLLSGTAYRLLQAAGRSSGLRMLMYHRVTDAHPQERLCVRVQAFADQMRWLHDRGYRTLTFAQAVEVARRKRPLSEKMVVLTFDDGYADNFQNAYPELKRYGFTGCFFVPSAFIESAGKAQHPPADEPMGWDMLQALLHDGHEVGAHSVTHRKLTIIPDGEAEWEVRASKEALEKGLGRKVECFCYPAGAYNASIRRCVEQEGYRGACTVKPGPVRPGDDPFELTRTEISGFDTPDDFEKKLAGAYDWLHTMAQWRQSLRKPNQCANAMDADSQQKC